VAIGRPKAELVLSAEEHAQVSALAASRALPHALVARASLVLWAARGESNGAIAVELTRFRRGCWGERKKENPHATNPSAIPAGVPAPHH
jgi:putative transposase